MICPKCEDDPHSVFLQWREIDIHSGEIACPQCTGAGIKVYPNTTTWRGGIGGQMLTPDVCNHCWGSGKKDLPWPSHRTFYELVSKERNHAVI